MRVSGFFERVPWLIEPVAHFHRFFAYTVKAELDFMNREAALGGDVRPPIISLAAIRAGSIRISRSAIKRHLIVGKSPVFDADNLLCGNSSRRLPLRYKRHILQALLCHNSAWHAQNDAYHRRLGQVFRFPVFGAS
jgi:hypothetical protein